MKHDKTNDERLMAHALHLAAKGQGFTSPNPMVGAIIVKQGTVIGQGYHHNFGAAHAEIEALKSCKSNPKGATLYVNLEPCAHFGHTPPCTEAIIRAGIKRVVCSTLDPNKAVNGLGITLLEQAGITCTVDVSSQEALELNESFFVLHTKNRPFVAIKFAMSLDGKMSTKTNDSKWITNDQARTYARQLRSHYQAIVVGVKTVLEDDPHLGSRVMHAYDPLRIILDSKLRTPLTAQILRDQNVIIASTSAASKTKRDALRQKGVTVISFESDQVPIVRLLEALKKRNIGSLFIEGGGTLIGSFIDAQCVDRVYAFYAPILIGGYGAGSIRGNGAVTVQDALKLNHISTKRFSDNFLITGSLSND